MRSHRKGAGMQRSRADNSFWLSFSDLMSSLVLIIILVMFYIIYQYFNLAELNQAEIARREYQLDAAQAELEDQKTKLSDAEKQMIAQQILLDAKQKELDDAQDVLEAQKTELSATQSQLEDLGAQLSAQQSQLEDQQSRLSVQQSQLEDQQSRLEDQQAQMAVQQSQMALQQAQLEDQQTQIEQLVGMRPRIIASLSDALRQASITASVDSTTGSITLESDVLFESGSYNLSSDGRRFVDRFLPVYLEVLFSDDYSEYVSEIIIEGHTDSDGGYLSNLALSQQRALAVASYVLGADCRAVSGDLKNELRQIVTVNGRSYSDRIFDASGQEDKDASRRVVFKFRLTDEQMIQQLRQILESE